MNALNEMTGKTASTIHTIHRMKATPMSVLWLFWFFTGLLPALVIVLITDDVGAAIAIGLLSSVVAIGFTVISVLFNLLNAMAEHIMVIEASLRAGAEAQDAIDKAKKQ